MNMFYFWSSGDKGDLWLSGEGLRQAFSIMNPEAPVCSEVVLLGEKNLLNVTFVLEPGTPRNVKESAEESFLEFARSLGIDEVQAGWVKDEAGKEPLSSKGLLQSPFLWGGLAWVAVSILRLGLSWTLVATAAAAAAFFVAALFTTSQGMEVRRWVKDLKRKWAGRKARTR